MIWMREAHGWMKPLMPMVDLTDNHNEGLFAVLLAGDEEALL